MGRRRKTRWLAWAALLAGSLLCSGRALAYEDQITLGLGAGYGSALSDVEPRHGVVTDLSLGLGLSPVWTLRGRLGHGLHPGSEPMHVAIAGGELLYVVDILELVPYFGLGADAFGRFRAGDAKLDAATHLVLGLDYLLSRELTLELDLRAHLRLTDLEGDPVYLAAVTSVVLMFDL